MIFTLLSLKVCFGQKINVKETLNERKGNCIQGKTLERLSQGSWMYSDWKQLYRLKLLARAQLKDLKAKTESRGEGADMT